MKHENQITAVVPAAGVGSRMKANKPKQYLIINDKTILQHTVDKLLTHPRIHQVIISISENDPYYAQLPLKHYDTVTTVIGGKERADSVLAGLYEVKTPWVMVHDAARPCVRLSDVDQLIAQTENHASGGILAYPVRDTMKRGTQSGITSTVDRGNLWHALTPQMFPTAKLVMALESAMKNAIAITDEASAMEALGVEVNSGWN